MQTKVVVLEMEWTALRLLVVVLAVGILLMTTRATKMKTQRQQEKQTKGRKAISLTTAGRNVTTC